MKSLIEQGLKRFLKTQNKQPENLKRLIVWEVAREMGYKLNTCQTLMANQRTRDYYLKEHGVMPPKVTVKDRLGLTTSWFIYFEDDRSIIEKAVRSTVLLQMSSGYEVEIPH